MAQNNIWVILIVVLGALWLCYSRSEGFDKEDCYRPLCSDDGGYSCKPGYTIRGVRTDRCYGPGGCNYGNKRNVDCKCCKGDARVCPRGEKLVCNDTSCKCVKWDCYESQCSDGQAIPCKKGYKISGNTPGGYCGPTCAWAGKYASGCNCCKE